MPGPTPPQHIQLKSRWKPHIRFKGQRFCLIPPATENPLNRKRPRLKANGETCVFEPSRRESQVRFELAAASLPVCIEHAPLTQACGLHPLQQGSPPASVVGDETGIPRQKCHYHYADVNQEKAPHVPL